MKKITYVFPIYNEEKTINALVDSMNSILKQVSKKYEHEVVFVNDGSKDKSLELLIAHQQKNKNFHIINFSRNFGHQIAVTAGLDYASGDAVIIMDADLQDPPEVSLELIKKWEEGFEVVYAQRRTRKDSFFKKLTAFLFYRALDNLANIQIPKDTGDFRLIDRKVVDTINSFGEHDRFLRGMMSFVGFKQTAVMFDRHERYAGETHYPIKKMIKLALDGIFSFSKAPLNFIMQFNSLVLLISGLCFLIFITWDATISPISDLTIIITVNAFFASMIGMTLGIIGLYIGRIYTESLNRPLYIVSSIYSNGKDTTNRN